MDQDGTWHGGRPQPRLLCVRWDPALPPQKGGGVPYPIFGKFLLCPNGWMHHDASWYGVGLSPGDFVFDEDPAPPQKGGGLPPQFSAHVYCGQTAGWIKMALGMEVSLGPSHIVLDGEPAPSPKRGPIFGPLLLLPNGWMHQDAT